MRGARVPRQLCVAAAAPSVFVRRAAIDEFQFENITIFIRSVQINLQSTVRTLLFIAHTSASARSCSFLCPTTPPVKRVLHARRSYAPGTTVYHRAACRQPRPNENTERGFRRARPPVFPATDRNNRVTLRGDWESDGDGLRDQNEAT